jgi:DNA-binding phage protein
MRQSGFHVRKTKGVFPPEQDIIATLDAALKRKDRREFLTALKPIVIKHGGFKAIARVTTLNRTALYRLLSSAGDAKLSTLLALLPSIGMRLSLKRLRKPKRASQKQDKAKTRIARTVHPL